MTYNCIASGFDFQMIFQKGMVFQQNVFTVTE